MWEIEANGHHEGKTLKGTLESMAKWCVENDLSCPFITFINFDGKYFNRSFPKLELKAQFYLEDVLAEMIEDAKDEDKYRRSLTRYYEQTRF